MGCACGFTPPECPAGRGDARSPAPAGGARRPLPRVSGRAPIGGGPGRTGGLDRGRPPGARAVAAHGCPAPSGTEAGRSGTRSGGWTATRRRRWTPRPGSPSHPPGPGWRAGRAAGPSRSGSARRCRRETGRPPDPVQRSRSTTLSYDSLLTGSGSRVYHPPMFERFSDRARRVVVQAQEEARRLNHNHIAPEHLLLALLDGQGLAARALQSLGVQLEDTAHRIEARLPVGEGPAALGHIPFTWEAKKVLELSLREALSLGHNYIGTKHILLGLFRESQGDAGAVVQALGVGAGEVRATIVELLRSEE